MLFFEKLFISKSIKHIKEADPSPPSNAEHSTGKRFVPYAVSFIKCIVSQKTRVQHREKQNLEETT